MLTARRRSTRSLPITCTCAPRRTKSRSTNASRQPNEERRALAGPALGGDRSTMALDDPLHRCEPDAGAGEVARARQPLERPEQLVILRHVEADAVVAHEQRRRTGML